MYNSIRNNIIKSIFFVIVYNYKSKFIKNTKDIKIIIKKTKILIQKLQKL